MHMHTIVEIFFFTTTFELHISFLHIKQNMPNRKEWSLKNKENLIFNLTIETHKIIWKDKWLHFTMTLWSDPKGLLRVQLTMRNNIIFCFWSFNTYFLLIGNGIRLRLAVISHNVLVKWNNPMVQGILKEPGSFFFRKGPWRNNCTMLQHIIIFKTHSYLLCYNVLHRINIPKYLILCLYQWKI